MSLYSLPAVAPQAVVNALAQAMCRIEARRTAQSFDDLVAPGIQLWTRHIYEAERLLEELTDSRVVVRVHEYRYQLAESDGFVRESSPWFATYAEAYEAGLAAARAFNDERDHMQVRVVIESTVRESDISSITAEVSV